MEKYEFNGQPSLPRPDLKPPPGWSLEMLASLDRIYNHSLSPDGKQVAFFWYREGQCDLYCMPSSGGWPRRLTFNRAALPFWLDEIPRWSPDSRRLAFTMDGQVHTISATGITQKKIVSFASNTSSPVWMPNGDHLVLLIEEEQSTHLYLTDEEGSFLRALTRGEGDNMDPQPSPDGRIVTYVQRKYDDLGRLDIHYVDIQTGQSSRLVGAARQKNWSPRWSPDGASIAFLSQRSGYTEVWITGNDGSHLHQMTNLNTEVSGFAWSPDGHSLALVSHRDGAEELSLLDIQSGEIQGLRGGLGCHYRPNWSPGGDFLTVEHESATHPAEIYSVRVSDGRVKQLTFSTPPLLANLPLVVPERVCYPSWESWQIPAYLFRPSRPNSAAIVYPHGGPSDRFGYQWDAFAQYLVAKGYTYLAPNYRGSTGYGLDFENANLNDWGGLDAQDCLYAADLLTTLPEIDPSRVAIYGPSYGGYLAACCLSRDPQYHYACAVSKYGDTNLTTSWAQCNRWVRWYTESIIGHPATNQQVYQAGSPLFQVDSVHKPVLILHGLEDTIVSPHASEEWANALRLAGKTYEYKTYAGEPHGFLKRENILDAYRRIEQFLDWHLLPPPVTVSPGESPETKKRP